MENRMDDERWVDARLETLDPPEGWRPDPYKAFRRLEQRDRSAAGAAWRRRGVLAAVGISVIGIALLVVPMSQKCAAAGCTDRTPPPTRSFKESGAAAAPVVCEIYTDYQCPACARFYAETVPLLVKEYVETGKVRILHRDLPLPAHPYARLAARYANAAGLLGEYERAANQIFRTQAQWSISGDVESQAAQVLPAETMERVRDLVNHDARLDETVATDLAMAREDGITQTPSLVIVWKGRRQVISGAPDFGLLKGFLDRL
jgi:protein-disulfide isomerase